MAAIDAFDFVATDMSAGDRLFHGWRESKARHPATVDDYAQMALAATALHGATGQQRFLNHAERWTATLDHHYWDKDLGGYYFSADDTADVIIRTKTPNDNATPAGNGVMVGVLARLFYVTGNAAYRERADRVVAAFSGELKKNFFGLCTLLNQNELLQTGLQAVLVGPPDIPETKALATAVYGRSLPNRIMVNVPDGAALPPTHPAAGKGMVRGKPALYLCRGTTCSLPLTDAAAVSRALAAS
jgi:uncharacterized protein YyaL (SSP411 family)